MKVILLQKVHKLGELGKEVNVKRGYGRYLIPKGLALLATKENQEIFNVKQAEYQKQEKEKLDAAMKRAESFKDVELVIKARTGEEGKLFGSIGTFDIVEAALEKNIPLKKQEVRLSAPIRQIGEYEIELQLHTDIHTVIKVRVESES